MGNEYIVSADSVRLGLEATTRVEALKATTALLQGDPRVLDWDELWKSVGERQVAELGCGVCVAHGRRGVKELVLAAARLEEPVLGETGVELRYVFVFGIPEAMSEDYLRVVGALARTCGCDDHLKKLGRVKTSEEFADFLEEWIG